MMGVPAWLQQLLEPYLKLLAPAAQQIGPEFHQITGAVVVALSGLARPFGPLLHQLADTVSPHMLVRAAAVDKPCKLRMRCVMHCWI